MPACIDCQWHEASSSKCRRPKEPIPTIDASTGLRSHLNHGDLTVTFERVGGANYPIPTCGPTGRFFQPIPRDPKLTQ